MLRVLKKIWADPVWSKVIAAAILALAGFIASYLFNWWPAIAHAVGAAWGFLVGATVLPNWAIGFGFILTLPTFIILYAMVRGRFADAAGPDWRSYTKDQFFGLVWRWR